MGNNPDPVSPVRGIDGASWNNKRLDFVTFAFQVNAHLLEYHSFVPSNKPTHIFSDDPVWLDVLYDLKHVRPLIAVICRAFSSSCVAEWLAGEASCEYNDVLFFVAPSSTAQVRSSRGFCFSDTVLMSLAVGVGNKVGDITVKCPVRPVLLEYYGGEFCPFAEDMVNFCLIEYLLQR